jgi:hypothetical protein
MAESFRACGLLSIAAAICLSAILASASLASAAGPILLITDGTTEVTCRLTCNVEKIRRGATFTLTSTLVHPRVKSLHPLVVFNPFLERRDPEHVEVRVFRADGTYVGDLHASGLMGGPRDAKRSDFVELPFRGEVGTKLSYEALILPLVGPLRESQQPGKYRLQIAFSSNVVAPPGILHDTPERVQAAINRFQGRTDYTPNAVVSNVVDLEVLEAEPTPTAVR